MNPSRSPTQVSPVIVETDDDQTILQEGPGRHRRGIAIPGLRWGCSFRSVMISGGMTTSDEILLPSR